MQVEKKEGRKGTLRLGSFALFGNGPGTIVQFPGASANVAEPDVAVQEACHLVAVRFVVKVSAKGAQAVVGPFRKGAHGGFKVRCHHSTRSP